MNKGMKYLLGFVTIFIAAVICVFGIIKYEEMKEESATNNSANLGSADGKKVDKDTSVIVEKIATLNDIDALNSELHLSQSVVDILKKYSPTVHYTVDNSEGDNKLYFRIGGYLNNNKTNEIIGSYKIDGGKLTSSGDDLGKISSKVNNNDKLKWKQLDLENKEHDKDIAEMMAKKYLGALLGGRGLNMTSVFGYLADRDSIIKPPKGSNVTGIVPKSLAELVDLYNASYKETYTVDQVKKELAKYTNKYSEVDDSFIGNENKYISNINVGDLIYFKKDNVYVVGMGGIGGVMTLAPASKDRWITEGDKITIPLINTFEGGKLDGQMILRLNNKKYEGGQNRSKYYIESISK